MKKNQNVLGIAFIIVAIQLFLLLLPTTRYAKEGKYRSSDAHSEAYSSVQIVINYNDTVNDPDASSDLVNDCYIYGAVTVFLMLIALVNFVQAMTFDRTSRAKMCLLCWASFSLALVSVVNWFFLKGVYDDYGENVFITWFGYAQIALLIGFPFLFGSLVPDDDFSSSNQKDKDKMDKFFKSVPPTPASAKKTCPYCGDVVTSNKCGMCGKEIPSTSEKKPSWK